MTFGSILRFWPPRQEAGEISPSSPFGWIQTLAMAPFSWDTCPSNLNHGILMYHTESQTCVLNICVGSDFEWQETP